jgi:hypothetical protein
MTSRRTVLGMIATTVVATPLLDRSSVAQAAAGGVSPWSVSPSQGSGWNPSDWAAKVAAIGVKNARGFRVDSGGYEKIRAAGLTSTGILRWSPPGAFRFPVDNLKSWQDYVATMVRTHPGVKQWEVWNEPPNFTADPSPASYAKIVMAAHGTVKAIDPTVQIGLATKATNTAWLREAILAGAAGHYDYVTVHPYERAGAIADGWEGPFLAVVPQLRAMLSEVDPTKVGVPVEFTEVGAPAAQHPGSEDPRSTPEEQARTLVKVMTMGVAQGAQRVSWYDPFDGDYDAGEAAYGLIARDGSTRPSFHAYKNLIGVLGERPTFVGLVQPQHDTYLFVFSRSDGQAAVVGWTHAARRTVSFSGNVRLTNPTTSATSSSRTVPLGSNPTIVLVPNGSGARDWLTRARDAEAKRSVIRSTASWNARTGPVGLHLRRLGGPVVVDGRTVRQPTGSVVPIAVGPGIDLHASGVKVTAVVRGVRGNPGFNLKYDVDAPLSSLDWNGQRFADGGWRQVGSGEWRTLTWTITDLRLAGMYGFNFQLDSDSQVYNGYQIESISLEVLARRGASGVRAAS